MRSRRPGLASILIAVAISGCEGKKPPAPPVLPAALLSVGRANAPTRVFSGEEEVPPTSYGFDGARGNVRVSMEVEGVSTSAAPVPLSVNDILFKASGDGRISVEFKRPWPGHDRGRVTIRCLSGGEESAAKFEPELWYNLPSAIVTFESPLGERPNPAVEGREIVLGRYVARNLPRDIHLTFKAVFSKEPIGPRTKTGLKPPR